MHKLALLVLVALAAPVAVAEEAPRADDTTRQLALSSNHLGCDLYGRLREREGNLFCAPYSVTTALAMTYAGARGTTASEMAAVLHLPAEGGRDVHAGFAALGAELASVGEELHVANGLWGQRGEPFLDSYLALVRAHYGAGFRQADFRGAAEAARREINAWAAQQTRERIPELLRPGLLTPTTSLVLANATYFKGAWERPFPTRATGARPFRLRDGESVAVPTMHQIARFRYAEDQGMQALELPYRGGRVALVVLLPADLPAFERGLDAARLGSVAGRLTPQQVCVFLPRFVVASGFSLADTLAALGMPTAFTGRADFSGMNGCGGLFISAVEHKAFVAVDEAGTEAAAATAVVMKRGGTPPGTKLFRADRPFLFLIRDRQTGCILFLGRVVDPRGAAPAARSADPAEEQ